ncbi:hypothetical protein [Streptomyces sp. S1]|uniref:hypothetical protein n=1 Tax=Streptomyces sp. S1 TaxID=718288 RepID=UPI003D73C543
MRQRVIKIVTGVLFSVMAVAGLQTVAHADPGWGRSAPAVAPVPAATPTPTPTTNDPGWG